MPSAKKKTRRNTTRKTTKKKTATAAKGRYVDGFVLPLPMKNIEAYKQLARVARKVWMEHGALQYVEAIGEDLATPCGLPFPKLLKTKPSETVVFAWITYRSRKHRDLVNKKVMHDPRLLAETKMPFDMNRITFAGFDIAVQS